jgi:hypothetical protein
MIPESRAATPRMNTHNVRVHTRVIAYAKQRTLSEMSSVRPHNVRNMVRELHNEWPVRRKPIDGTARRHTTRTVHMHTRSKRSRRTDHTTGSAWCGRQAEDTGHTNVEVIASH